MFDASLLSRRLNPLLYLAFCLLTFLTQAAPLLPTENYVRVVVNNLSMDKGSGLSNDKLWLSLISNTQAYRFNLYQDASGRSVYVAEVDSAAKPGGYVAALPLSALINQRSQTIGFYIQVSRNGAPLGFNSGRLYFSDRAQTVQVNDLGLPAGVAANAGFNYDFVEFTVDPASNQLNLDTTQVDQFGMPIYLQVSPAVPDFPNGTGIISTQSRSGVIGAFNRFAQQFPAYAGVVQSGPPTRLLAPQHVIDAQPQAEATRALRASFDAALYRFFNYYSSLPGGGQHKLYLVGNGRCGDEIFEGQVKKTYTLDAKNQMQAYTVFEFKGSGYRYAGPDSRLSPALGQNPTCLGQFYGGATYRIYYPYFSTNEANSYRSDLSSASPAPLWFAPRLSNLPLSSASRMVLGCSGVFADDVQQAQYYLDQPPSPANPNFDHKMLGNLQNQIVTLINRGISPDTGNSTLVKNLHVRTGSFSALDLISLDLSHARMGSTPTLAPGKIVGAAAQYFESDLIQAIGGTPAQSGIQWSSLRGRIYYQGQLIQSFSPRADLTQPFILSSPSGSPANSVDRAYFVFNQNQVARIEFVWKQGLSPNQASSSMGFRAAPRTQDAHYANLRLFSPYDPDFQGKAPTDFTNFTAGELGPSGLFAWALRGASTANAPTSGMSISSAGLSQASYVYAINPGKESLIVYSPLPLKGTNSNIFTFADFYPSRNGAAVGTWNAYSGFFHNASAGNAITVDGKGYAFAFDDNGGYSSDISLDLPAKNNGTASVVSSIQIRLLPW